MADLQQYREGYPNKKGYYHCLIDDEIEMQLYLFVCELNPRKKYWVMPDGAQLFEDEVRWKPK